MSWWGPGGHSPHLLRAYSSSNEPAMASDRPAAIRQGPSRGKITTVLLTRARSPILGSARVLHLEPLVRAAALSLPTSSAQKKIRRRGRRFISGEGAPARYHTSTVAAPQPVSACARPRCPRCAAHRVALRTRVCGSAHGRGQAERCSLGGVTGTSPWCSKRPVRPPLSEGRRSREADRRRAGQ